MSKLSYNNILLTLEEKKCKLLLTKEEFENQKISYKLKIKIQSSCGHESITTLKDFIYFRCGINCKDCKKKLTSLKLIEYNKGSIINKNNKQEFDGYNILESKLKDHFIVKLLSEGTLADFIIKPLNSSSDNWLPIQLKTTSSSTDTINSYKFNVMKPKYYNMPVCLFAINDMKIWLLNGEEIDKSYINIGKKKSMYNKYLIDIDKLNEPLKKFYDNGNFNNTLEILNTPISPQCKVERLYRLKREQYITFLNFEYPLFNYQVFDFTINNKKIQEKVAIRLKKYPKHFFVTLKKNRDK